MVGPSRRLTVTEHGAPARESAGRLSAAAEKKGIALRVRVPDGPVWVLGDEEALRQVADNLIVNAVKYTPERGHVEVRVVSRDGSALLEVDDDGPGIEPKHRERIFERFYRVDKARSRATGGTGLGLSIVRHVAANHGGTVTVESREGEGSTFTLRLPRAGAGLTHLEEAG